MERSEGGARSRQSQALDEFHGLRPGPSHSPVATKVSVERRETAITVEMMPALKRSRADPSFPSEDDERDLVFDMQSKNPPPLLAVHDRYIVVARGAWDCRCR